MRKARHPLPLEIVRLRFNPNSGKYEISENEILYRFDYILIQRLKWYYSAFMPVGRQKYATIAGWYNDLSKEEKKKVERIGDIPEEDNGFYADVEYE